MAPRKQEPRDLLHGSTTEEIVKLFAPIKTIQEAVIQATSTIELPNDLPKGVDVQKAKTALVEIVRQNMLKFENLNSAFENLKCFNTMLRDNTKGSFRYDTLSYLGIFGKERKECGYAEENSNILENNKLLNDWISNHNIHAIPEWVTANKNRLILDLRAKFTPPNPNLPLAAMVRLPNYTIFRSNSN